MVGGSGRASGMPGKLHAVSLRLAISHGETGWTCKACHRSFFHLRQYHLNDFGTRTSGSFPHRWSARFTNGIASRATLARAWFGGFGRNLRRGQRRSGIRGRLCGLGDVWHLWYASHWKRSLAVSRFPWCTMQKLELLRTLEVVGCHFVFACTGLQFQTHPFGWMKHGACEHVLGSACPSLREGCRHRIDEPRFHHPDTSDTPFCKPSPALEQSIQVRASRSPVSGIRSSRYVTAATHAWRSSCSSTW